MTSRADSIVTHACADPAASNWFKSAAMSALDRDPVDAANDAEELARLLSERATEIQQEAEAALRPRRPETISRR